MPCCWTPAFFCQTLRTYHAWVCLQSRLICICVSDVRRTCWSIPSEIYTPLRSVRGHTTSMFFTGRTIAWMARIFFLVTSVVALIKVGSRGGFSYLLFPYMDDMVGIFPYGVFRRCSSLVDLFRDFHPLKHITGLLICLPFEAPSLLILLIRPAVSNGV